MTERTLSGLLRASIFIVIVGFVLMQLVFSGVVMPKYIRYAYAFVFGITPILLMMKVFSRMSLPALKDQPLSSLEQMFMVFYAFLTKEAREDWRSHIKQQKNK